MFWSGGVTESCLFQNEYDHADPANGVRYTTDYLLNELEYMDDHKMWVQQDGANFHTSNEILNLSMELTLIDRLSRAASLD